MIISTSTDDFLRTYSHDITYTSLVTHLKGYFEITDKQAAVVEYLNLSIIQTQHGISSDQNKDAKKIIISKFFLPSTIERLEKYTRHFVLIVNSKLIFLRTFQPLSNN